MTMTVETVSKETSWTESMASRWTNPPPHVAPNGAPTTPTRRRKHLMVGMSGLFVLLTTTCQFESFQGNMTRLRRLRAGFFLSHPSLLESVVVNDDDDDDDYNNNDNHEDIYNDYLYNGSNPHVLKVRDWGCSRRHEAPLIFVHLGKCGGGSVRARLAASALDYHRDHWANVANDSTYYYPMLQDDQQSPILHRGIFASSSFYNFRPSYPVNATLEKDIRHADQIWKTFEKTLPCHATTPLGQAIACPLVQAKSYIQPHCQNDQRCNVVYAGHNLLGNELHWLPTPYLAQWWNTTVWAQQQNQHSSAMFESWWQERSTRWNHSSCQFDNEYDHPYHYYKSHYRDCVAPREAHVDQQAHAVQTLLQHDWSALYASLPVLRITMLREPFAWLVSKFFWHRGMHGRVRGTNQQWIRLTTCHGGISVNNHTNTTSTNTTNNNHKALVKMAAWVAPAALKQMYHLCGEECLVRHHAGIMTLEQLEAQARHNLLQSFAVVGLLHETPKFYDMITARVAYMNTTLNPNVTGSSHSTQAHAEYQQCRNLYQTREFQKQLLAVCPELQALVRLYHVGVAVNRHQIQEMQSCGTLPPFSLSSLSSSTNTNSPNGGSIQRTSLVASQE